MSVTTEVPVSEIQGIGVATAERLAAHGLGTVLALLGASPGDLHQLVSDLASYEEVVAWRQMAALLQARTMTADWAEALVKKSVNTLGALSHLSVLEALQLFEEAREAGTCRTVPGLVDLVEMLVDAARLHYSGSIYGRIVDSDNEPLEGLEVRFAYLRATCDAAGRFHLLRVPLERTPPLTCHWQPDKSFAFEVSISPSAATIVEQRLELPATWTDPVPAQPDMPRASELDGDPFPRIAGHRLRTVDMTDTGLREDDLLVVDHLYKNDPEAKLASRLRVFERGEVLVYTYRVPLADLPDGVVRGDGFHVRAGALQPVEVDLESIHLHRVRLRGRRKFGSMPVPQTRAELIARQEEIISFTERELYHSDTYRSP